MLVNDIAQKSGSMGDSNCLNFVRYAKEVHQKIITAMVRSTGGKRDEVFTNSSNGKFDEDNKESERIGLDNKDEF